MKTILRARRGNPADPADLMDAAGRALSARIPRHARLCGRFRSFRCQPRTCGRGHAATDRRYGFDAAILLPTIPLILPRASRPRFETGEGSAVHHHWTRGLQALKGKDDIHETLAPVYETVRLLSGALPRETTPIGFAGAPWTVATYMIAGRGTPGPGPGSCVEIDLDRATFEALIDLLTGATIEYLSKQVERWPRSSNCSTAGPGR